MEEFKISIGAELNTSDFDNLKNQISRTKIEPIKISIDTQNVQSELNNIKKQIQGLSNIKINLSGVSTQNISKTFNDGSSSVKSFQQEVNSAFTTLMSKQREINSLKIKAEGLDKTSSLYAEIKKQMDSLGTSYVDLKNKFAEHFSTEQLERLTAEFDIAIDKINILRASKVDEIELGIKNGDFEEKVNSIKSKAEEFQSIPKTLGENIESLNSAFETMRDSGDMDERLNAMRTYQQLLPEVQTRVNQLANAEKSVTNEQNILTKSSTLSNNISAWMNQNTKAAEQFGDRLRNIKDQLQDNKEPELLRKLSYEFASIKSEAKAAGLVTDSFAVSLKNTALQVLGLTSSVMVFRKVMQEVKVACQTIVELDTALVDLRKTTDATEFQLKEFYYSANDTAKSLGTTTQEVIQAAAEWSRLGYSIKDAQTMAETSSIFASISPDMDISTATDGLVSAMKAFNIEAEDALDGVASKINAIGNTQAITNGDIVNFLTRSSSAMKEANNTLDETIALGTAAVEITRDSMSVGNALKTKIIYIIVFVYRNMHIEHI